MSDKTDASRRSLLTALGASGAAAVGLSFAGGLTGCSPKEAAKTATGAEEPKLNFYKDRKSVV